MRLALLIALPGAMSSILLAIAPVASQQPTIRLDGVPDSLELPLAAGRNLIVTVVIGNAEARSAWVASGPDATGRAPCTPVGDGRWQFNLADRAIADLLHSAVAGQFQVFAELDAGEILASLPVRYAVRGVAHSRVSLAIRSVAPARSETRSETTTTHDSFGARSLWVDVGGVTGLQWRFGDRDGVAPVGASAGESHWPLVLDPGAAIASLAVDDAVRAAWTEHGELLIEPANGSGFTLIARPDRLFLAGIAGTFTVEQRHSEAVPGTRGWLRVTLGDITAGQVLLTVHSAEHDVVVPRRSLRVGEDVTFRLGEEDYVLSVDRLVNFLIGDDFAELSVSAVALTERRRIAALLDAMRVADVVFVREGADYSGGQAAEHLERKWRLADRPVRTRAEFIEQIGSRSSVTGSDYLVRTPAGETVPARDWLQARAREIDARVPDEPVPDEPVPAESARDGEARIKVDDG